METVSAVSEWFWAESFWLTPGTTWNDLKNTPGSDIYLPQTNDMLWCIPLAILLIVLRFIFERFISAPLGERMGIREKKKPNIEPHPVLEDLYLQNGTATNNNLESVAKKADLSVREVERWLRDRQTLSKTGTLIKFTECSWHFLFYVTSFIFGLYTLWDKPWLWETKHCWMDWPKIGVTNDLFAYYLLQLAFYLSLVFTVLVDNKRKDFKEMFIHHIITIILVFFSWSTNFVRIGSLIILCHDLADSPLALSKMMKYCGKQFYCEAIFVIFLIFWFFTRLVYLPCVIIYAILFELHLYMSYSWATTWLSCLLVVLQILHLMWSYLIARIVWRMFHKKSVMDVRSESESD